MSVRSYPLASSIGIDYFIAKPYEKKVLIDKIYELTGGNQA
jgi:hypothetical protein